MECKDIHRKVPNTIIRTMPRQICGEEVDGTIEEREERTVDDEDWKVDSRNPRGVIQ